MIYSDFTTDPYFDLYDDNVVESGDDLLESLWQDFGYQKYFDLHNHNFSNHGV